MPKLFVISPFGTKAASHGAGGVIHFDELYLRVVRPAAEEAGWTTLRIDEVVAPGLITDQYLREIHEAEMALGDISIPNANVFYELGIRQSVSTGGTILIAHQGSQIPFDLTGQRILFYEQTERGEAALRRRLAEALKRHGVEEASRNPVRSFLEEIGAVSDPEHDPVAFEREIGARISRCRTVDQLIAVWHWVKNVSPVPARSLLNLGESLAEFGEWGIASDVLEKAAEEHPNDFEIHRQLGWYLQHLGEEEAEASVAEFECALALNASDPETLGMLGGHYKRRGKFREASSYYELAAELSPNSLYVLVNLAAVQVLANSEDPTSGIERYGKLAERLRAKVRESPDEWAELVLAESLFAIGDQGGAREHYAEALRLGASRKSAESAARQLRLFAEAGFRSEAALELAGFLSGASPQVEINELTVASADSELAKGPILVHLSDIHFGALERDGKRVEMHRFADWADGERLATHIIRELSAKGSRYAGELDRIHLVVSGDLAYTGTKAEFEQARACLDEICTTLGIPRERVHIIPGNHDVNWADSRDNKSLRFDEYINFLVRFYGVDLLKERFPRLDYREPLVEAHKLVSVAHCPESRLLVVGMNSCIFETEQHHYGFVGHKQLVLVRDMIRELGVPDETVRVALIHHHLHPQPEALITVPTADVWLDMSTVRDAGYVEQFLEKMKFDLILHGHKHKPQLRETIVRNDPAPQQADHRPLIVCGAGSVSCTELEHSEPNQYQIVEIRQTPRRAGVDFLRVEWRTLPVKTGAEWSTAGTWDVLG